MCIRMSAKVIRGEMQREAYWTLTPGSSGFESLRPRQNMESWQSGRLQEFAKL